MFADLSISQCSDDIAESRERFVDVLSLIQHRPLCAGLAHLINATSQLILCRPVCTLSTTAAACPILQVPCTRTAHGSRAFSSAVPAIWNNLPTSVIGANSLPVFCCRLKTHLFAVAFENSG